MYKYLSIIIPSVFLATTALAQDKAIPTDPIETDRPDFTESTSIVPTKWLQIEMGLTVQKFSEGTLLSGPEALLRYGLNDNAEVRLGIPDYGGYVSGDLSTSGIGDTYVGMKYAFDPITDKDKIALIPALNIPSHDEPLSSDSVDPELKLCWSHDFTERLGFTTMAYGIWTTNDDDRVFGLQQTISLGYSLTDALGSFVEYAGAFVEESSPENVVDAGITYLLNSNNQLDLYSGFTMNGDHDPFYGAGYSFRF